MIFEYNAEKIKKTAGNLGGIFCGYDRSRMNSVPLTAGVFHIAAIILDVSFDMKTDIIHYKNRENIRCADGQRYLWRSHDGTSCDEGSLEIICSRKFSRYLERQEEPEPMTDKELHKLSRMEIVYIVLAKAREEELLSRLLT